MAKFTEIEEKLLKNITDDHLRTSLAVIREAVEKIWDIDAPRIIQDYTDHGIKHCERLVGFVTKLLDANDGHPLSAREAYLLLAGIYLHDIGMQCDVVKFPSIKQKAEALGAQYDVEFSAQRAGGYSINEQKAIRKNHQYLTVAWIDNANRTGDTLLGMAAKTVPEDIIDDLMDVCKHHAKLPITECPISFRFDPTERKQLVASLLRFSDELDIDAHRVSIETVKNFSLDPRNSVYWWLHNRTMVIFSARSVIILTIRLNPDDVKQLGSFVHAAFITEFQTKNHPVLTILGQNGIPIVISAESKVVEHDRAEPLPSEIIQALQTMQTKRDPLPVLADEVRTWLQAIRYEVNEPRQLNDRFMDMIATLDQGTVKQRVLVRCVDGEITPADVDELDVVLDRKTPQGWLISDRRVSDQARQRTTKDDAFQVFNLSDFLRQMVWRPYFDVLTALVEKDRIPELYVDLACYTQEMGEQGHEINRDKHASLDKYVDNWLKERGKMHISLLGEFGTGKTWFCRHYTYRQLERYLQDPVNERLPLLITLRMFAKAMTPQQLINDALLEQYKLPFVGSAFEIFQEMNRRGKLLLILDGFDEMARQVDYQTVVDNFWQLANLVDENSKVIITSRTEYFRWAKESENILGGEEYGRRTIVLQPPKFEVRYLEPFNDDQIRKVIIGRLGKEKGATTADRILNTPNLAEMVSKPVLIELLLAALDEVSADVLENPAQVYLYATNKLLLRNIDTQRTFTTTADKLYFLCELAWEMVKSSELRIHYTAIPERIKSYFGNRIKDQHELDTWDFDLRNQTLLHRDAAGYYEFAHKSLAEYFVAFKFAAELGCLAPVFAQTYCEVDGKSCQLSIVPKDIIGLAETFGEIALSDNRMSAVCDLLVNLLDENATKRLWEIVNETGEKPLGSVRYAGGNATTLLQMRKQSFKGVILAGKFIPGANLCGIDLSETKFNSTILVGVDFRSSVLYNANMADADLREAKFGESYWIRALALEIHNGRVLVCGGNTGSPRRDEGASPNFISLFDLEQERQVYNLPIGTEIIWAVSLHPSGNYAAVGGDDEQVFIIEVETGKLLTSWPGLGVRIHALKFSRNGKLLVCGDEEGVKLWEFNLSKESCLWLYKPLNAKSLIFIQDETQIAIGDFIKPYIWILDSKTGEIINRISRHPTNQLLHDVCINSNGDMLAYCTDRDIRIWNRYKQKEVKVLHYKKKRNPIITCVSFSPDGTKIASGAYDKTVRIWSVETGEELICMRGHIDYIYDLEWMLDGLNVISGSADSTIRIWDVDSKSPTFGQCLKVLYVTMNCNGTQIGGACGLEQEMTWEGKGKRQKGTLLEFLADRGAMLDIEQKNTLEKMKNARL